MQFKALLFLITIVVQADQRNEARNLSTGANDYSILAIILRHLFRIEAKQDSSPRLTDTLVQTINENKKLYEVLRKQLTDNKEEISLLKTNLQSQKAEFNREISALQKHHGKRYFFIINNIKNSVIVKGTTTYHNKTELNVNINCMVFIKGMKDLSNTIERNTYSRCTSR